MPNWKKVIVSGSNANLSTLSLTNSGSTADSLTLTSTEDSSTAAPVVSFKRNSSSPLDADYLGQLKFKGENDADQEVVYAKITAKIQDASDGTEAGLIEFANKKSGSNNITARLKSDKLQLINGTELEVDGQVSASSFIGDGSGLTGLNSGSLNLVGSGIVSGSEQVSLLAQPFFYNQWAVRSDGNSNRDVTTNYVVDFQGGNGITTSQIDTSGLTDIVITLDTGSSHFTTAAQAGLLSASTVSDTFTSATTHSISHTLGTKDLIINVYDSNDDIFVPTRINTPNTSSVVLYMDPATTGRVVIGKAGHIISSSGAAGLISSSAQFTDLSAPFTGSFTGSFVGLGTDLTNVTSSKAINTRDNSTISFWQGSQAQYDALGSYDSNVIYFTT